MGPFKVKSKNKSIIIYVQEVDNIIERKVKREVSDNLLLMDCLHYPLLPTKEMKLLFIKILISSNYIIL